MTYKLSDFFVGINEFFGILVPGAIFIFFQRDFFVRLLEGKSIADTRIEWVAFFLGSYILGHFILAFGVPINQMLNLLPSPWFSVENDAFYKEARPYIDLPKGEETRADAFHRAHSFVRLNNPAASADIDRQMEDYQLFRSLILVFGLDHMLALVRWYYNAPLPRPRIIFSGTLFVLALGRFPYLLKWTYRTTFEYYTILWHAQDREDQSKAPNSGASSGRLTPRA